MPLPKNNLLFGFAPKLTQEQREYVDSIFDNQLTIVNAKAGTGKTLLAVACSKVLNKELIYIFSPVEEKRMGFRPGSQEEKERAYISPLIDALLEINENPSQVMYSEETLENPGRAKQMMDSIKNGTVWVYPKSHIFARGTNIKNKTVIIDECLTGDSCIIIEGSKPKNIKSLYISYLKNKELPKALSYNETTEKFEYKEILNVVSKGSRKIIQVSASNRKIKCTKEHPFLTKRGWVEAGNLKEGDLLVTTDTNTLQSILDINDDQYQVFLGSVLGDGSGAKEGHNRYRLSIIHSEKQLDYCTWKAWIFQKENEIELIKENGYSKKPAHRFQTRVFGLDHNDKLSNIKEIPDWVIEDMDLRAIAIWIMDDGSIGTNSDNITISACSYSEESIYKIIKKFETFGFTGKLKTYEGYNYIIINKENFNKIKNKIYPYMHKSMLYKIRELDFNDVEPYVWNNEYKANGLTVVKNIKELNTEEEVYDLEIKDNHNFAVTCKDRKLNRKNFSGIIVHNCQNFTTSELKKVLTRIHDDCKVIMIGHTGQIDLDNKEQSGFQNYINHFQDKEYAKLIELNKNFRGRLARDADEI